MQVLFLHSTLRIKIASINKVSTRIMVVNHMVCQRQRGTRSIDPEDKRM